MTGHVTGCPPPASSSHLLLTRSMRRRLLLLILVYLLQPSTCSSAGGRRHHAGRYQYWKMTTSSPGRRSSLEKKTDLHLNWMQLFMLGDQQFPFHATPSGVKDQNAVSCHRHLCSVSPRSKTQQVCGQSSLLAMCPTCAAVGRKQT